MSPVMCDGVLIRPYLYDAGLAGLTGRPELSSAAVVCLLRPVLIMTGSPLTFITFAIDLIKSRKESIIFGSAVTFGPRAALRRLIQTFKAGLELAS